MTVGWAIIGTGRVAKFMATAIDEAEGSRLVAVVSRSEESALAFAEGHGSPTLYTDLDAMLADTAVTAVYVSSPNTLHRDQVIAAAAAGKHVLCEKPMAMDAQSCVDMIEACETARVTLALAVQFRQHPAHLLMRETVASGALGDIRFADASVFLGAAAPPEWYNDPALAAGSGVLSMAGVHRIDLLRMITGAEVVEVSAVVHAHGGLPYDDTIIAMLTFDNGMTATLRFASGMPRGADPLQFYGTGAQLSGVDTMSQWWSDAAGSMVITSPDGTQDVTNFEQPNLYRTQIESFERAVDGDTSGVASGLDGLRDVEISTAIYEAASSRATVKVVHHR